MLGLQEHRQWETAKNSQVFPLYYLKMSGFKRMVMFLGFSLENMEQYIHYIYI